MFEDCIVLLRAVIIVIVIFDIIILVIIERNTPVLEPPFSHHVVGCGTGCALRHSRYLNSVLLSGQANSKRHESR